LATGNEANKTQPATMDLTAEVLPPAAAPVALLALDLPAHPSLLPALRGAVVEQVLAHRAVYEAAGLGTDLFHNHDESRWAVPQPDTLHRYPLVQYKVRHRRAALLGLGQGAQAVQLWWALAQGRLPLHGREQALALADQWQVLWQPQLLDHERLYRLNKWLPLNAANYATWQRTPRLADKAQLLDRLLWGHLFHLLEGLGAQLPRAQVRLYVASIDHQSYQNCYGVRKLALDVTFATNVDLPPEIGLGQGVSVGFGKAQPLGR
jgi:hypothetical protein